MLYLTTFQVNTKSNYSALPDMLSGAAFALLVNDGNRFCWTSTGDMVFIVFNDDLAKYSADNLDIVRVDRSLPIKEVITTFTDETADRILWQKAYQSAKDHSIELVRKYWKKIVGFIASEFRNGDEDSIMICL